MPAKDLKQIITELTQGKPQENYYLDKEFVLSGRKFYSKVNFKNVTFKEEVSFIQPDFFQDFNFIDCTFEKGFNIVGTNFRKLCLIQNCVSKDEVFIRDCSADEMIFKEFKAPKMLMTGFLNEIGTKNNAVVFVQAFIEEFEVKEAEIKKPIKFEEIALENLSITNSKIYSSLSFAQFEEKGFFQAKNVYLTSSKFFQRLDFYYGVISDYLMVQKVDFNEQVVIRKEIEIKNIDLDEVKAKYSVSADFQDNYENLRISNCNFESSFSAYCLEKLNSYEKTVTIEFDGIIHGNIVIDDLPTLSVNISCVNFGNILFSDISTKYIWIDKLYNYNKLFFNSIKLNLDYNVLIIFNSNLGNTEFENINFKKFDEVVIAKSDISNMQLTNSLFPKEVQIKTKHPSIGVEIGEAEKINDNLYFKETYRQLKLAMEKVGNRYYALTYKSKELYYQRKELGFSWDKLLLYFNFFSNNHGISWIRGILFTLFCALLSFLYLHSQLSQPLFHWNQIQSIFNTGFSEFIKYLSSYPKLELNGLVDDNWKVNLTVLLSRIFVSYGIYQTIVAFRKYGK